MILYMIEIEMLKDSVNYPMTEKSKGFEIRGKKTNFFIYCFKTLNLYELLKNGHIVGYDTTFSSFKDARAFRIYFESEEHLIQYRMIHL